MKPSLPRLCLSACAIALAAALPARADETGVTVVAERPVADGQTTSRLDLSARRAETLHLGQLVASVPGALALDFGGLLATSTVSLRGGNADQAAILLDGIPLGSPAGGGLDLSLVPSALLDGLTLARGSDGRLGAAAMGGAIELKPATGTRAVLTAGSLDTLGLSAGTSHTFTARDASWSLSAAADLRRSGGGFVYHRDPTPEVAGNDAPTTLRRDNNDATIGSLLLRAERLSETGRLRLTAFGSGSTRGLPGPIYSPTPTARQDERSLSAQVAWRGASLELPVFARVGTLTTTSGDAWVASGTQAFEDLGTKPSYRWSLGPATLALSGLAGVEHFRGAAHGEHARFRGGLGAELAKERGTLTGSVSARAEWWGGAFGLLPRAGGSARLARGLYAYANAGGGFRPPSFGELYYAAGPVLPNPELQPERSWSGDLGLRLDRTNVAGVELSGSIATFAGSYDDVIVYELFSGSRAKPFNLGRARTTGVEVELALKSAAGLSIGASGTLLFATNLVEGANTYGNDLPYRPRTRAEGHVEYTHDRVHARAAAAWTAEAYANRANTRTIPSFVDVSASAGIRLAGDAWLSAEVRNALGVTDRACIEGYPLPGRIVLAHLSWTPASAEQATP